MPPTTQINIRRDTAANFTSANPTLALGEIAYETDTFRFKVGTGSTAWTALGYAAQNPTSLTVASDAFINGARVGIGPAGTDNTVLGVGAGAALQAGGNNNVCIGSAAGDAITTGDDNVAIGRNALTTASDSNKNTAVGTNAGFLLTGGGNVAVGKDALRFQGSGFGNVFIGSDARGGAGNFSNAIAIGEGTLIANLANDAVAVGSQSLDANTLGTANVAVGRSALGAATTAIATVTTTNAGTGGTDGAKTAIQLERDSGGTMATYPTVDLTVSGGAVSGTVTVATGGSGSTSNTAGGIIFRANAAGIAAGVPADWRCQLQTVSTAASNTAVGHQAGLSLTTASDCVLVGTSCGDALTTGGRNTALGMVALTSGTTANNDVAVGYGALALEVSGNSNVAVGGEAASNIGASSATATSGLVAIGKSAGRFRGSSTNTLTQASNSVFIGYQSRAADNAQTNQVVIAGFDGLGNGSNTTTIGNSSTTGTFIPAGTLNVAGTGIFNGGATVRPNASTGTTNVVLGPSAGNALGSANTYNVLIGGSAGSLLSSTASRNCGLGQGALQNAGSGTFDATGVGTNTLAFNTAPSNCVAIGNNAGLYDASGANNTSGTGCTFVGQDARPAASGNSNAIVIGYAARGDGSNTTVIGNTSTTSTRIPAGNLTLSNGNLILGTAGNGISFAATTDPSIPAVAATGAIRGTATNVSDGDTVTIDTTVYTFKTTLTPADYEVLIGADSSASLTNLRHAILGTGGTPGTDYQVPAAHPTVTAGAIAGRTLPLTAITAGTAGNSIALAETSAELSVSAATLQGGAAAAGMSGELLNDYETGTWSPRLESTGGTLVGVNTVNNANYTKIGQLVTVQAYISFNYADTSLASGQLRIAGLPYSVSGHAAAGLYSGQWTVSPAYVAAASGTTLNLHKRGSTSAQSGVAASVPADLDTSTTASRNQMVVTLTYRTA